MRSVTWLILLASACTFATEGPSPIREPTAPGSASTEPPRPPSPKVKPPPPSSWVTVALYREGEPLANRPVFAHDAHGTLRAEEMTNAQGQAEIAWFEGGMTSVFVVDETGNWYGIPERHMYSVMGAEPGEHLVFGDPERPPKVTPEGPQLILRAPEAVEGATTYTVRLGCDQATLSPSSLSREIELNPACAQAGFLDALFVATDTDGHQLALATVRDRDLLGQKEPIVIAPPAWESTETVTYFTAPPKAPNQDHGGVSAAAVRSGRAFTLGTIFQNEPGGLSLEGIPVSHPLKFADSFEVSYTYLFSPNNLSLRWRGTFDELPGVLDIRDLPTPPVIDAQAVQDARRPTVAITLDPSPKIPATLTMAFRYDPGYSYYTLSTWWISAPADTPEIWLPAFPESLKKYDPGPLPWDDRQSGQPSWISLTQEDSTSSAESTRVVWGDSP